MSLYLVLVFPILSLRLAPQRRPGPVPNTWTYHFDTPTPFNVGAQSDSAT